METLRILVSVILLSSCSQHAFGRSKKWVCEHGGREGKTVPFFKQKSPFLVNLPCRYKMANVACGGDQTEVYVEKDDSLNNNAYMTGVLLNITTTNSDNTVSYQQLALDNVKFGQYQDTGRFSVSPWEWGHTGASVNESRKVKGRYDARSKKAEVTVGKLTVLFTNVMSWQRRRHDKPTLEITCSGSELKAFEGYPATVCGGPDNSQDDVDSVTQDLQLDQHHHSDSVRDVFTVFTKQHVQQSAPLCMEMQKMMQTESSEIGEHLYDCNELFTSWGQDMRKRLCEGDTDRFKLYVTCMRVLTDGESTMTRMDQTQTCQLLQQATSDCQNKQDFHLPISRLQTMAGCPSNETRAAPGPEQPILMKYKKKGNRQTCKTRDVRTSYWNRYSPGDVSTFFGRDDINIELPCFYRMANIKCGGVQTEVFAGYAFDSQGEVYMSEIKTHVLVRHNLPVWGLVIGGHYNSVTNQALKEYIQKKDFTGKDGPWGHKRRGGPPPEGDNRIFRQFDRKTNSAVMTHRNLTVTYRYIDVSKTSRPEQDVLTITCSDPKFQAEESFPATVCGGRKDAFSGPDDLVDAIAADPHHKFYNNDILILAGQKKNQRAKTHNPLCFEAQQIVKAGGDHLGDTLAECFMMYRTSPFDMTYGRCMRQEKVDPFQFYVACLRVLSGAAGNTSRETCDVLQKAHDACGSAVDDPHMAMSQLLERAQCVTGAASIAP